MGFRGEALPSIASCSIFQIITKQACDDMATQININGGKLDSVQKTASKNGTNITVKNLFYNIPARRKFLKSEPIEFKHIVSYLHYQSVLFPQISFRLYHNQREKFNYPATDSLEKRMLDVFGTSFTKQNFIFFDTNSRNTPETLTHNPISLYGYLQDIEQPDPNSILDAHYIFVNRRYINDKVIYSAIKSAYEPFLKKYRFFEGGKLPNYILFLDITPEDIDVNVHPAKTEIRFKNIGAAYNFVKNTLLEVLSSRERQRYEDTKQKISSVPLARPLSPAELVIVADINNPNSNNCSIDINFKTAITEIDKSLTNYTQTQSYQPPPKPTHTEIQKTLAAMATIETRSEVADATMIQIHNSYILMQTDDGFVLIDQHAAHERIIYEKLLKNIDEKKPNKQKLVFPIVIDLPVVFSSELIETIEINSEIMHNMGFTIKSFSGNSIVIDEIPAELDYWDGGNVFIEILTQLSQELEEIADFRIASATSVACKAAIKAGKKLTKREISELIAELFTCQYPFQCPHGRPLIFRMTLNDIEKAFKRIV
jgi:DNA mismatch repair protein MutL